MRRLGLTGRDAAEALGRLEVCARPSPAPRLTLGFLAAASFGCVYGVLIQLASWIGYAEEPDWLKQVRVCSHTHNPEHDQ